MFGYCGVTDDKIYFGVPVSKYVFLATHRDAVLCVGGGGGGEFRDRDQACLPQIAKAPILNPVPVGQCHLIHLTILFSLHVHK